MIYANGKGRKVGKSEILKGNADFMGISEREMGKVGGDEGA